MLANKLSTLSLGLALNIIVIWFLLIIFFGQLLASDLQTCHETSRTCTSGAATRTINGTAIYKDCWSYAINYNCYLEGDYTDNCSQIKTINTCSQLSSRCQSNLANGVCASYKNQYVCSQEINNFATLNLTLESQERHITLENLDDASCQIYSQNPNCQETGEQICVEGAQTRIINGLEVARDCWRFTKKYYCKGQVGQLIDECTDYEGVCQLQSQQCLSEFLGLCLYNNKTYQCPTPATTKSISCGSQDYITYNKDQNFAKAAASLAFLGEAASQFDKDHISTFAGSSKKCGKDVIGYSNCCKMSGFGQDLSLASCSVSEKDLSVLRENKRCVYIGSYCSKKEPITKTCLEKKESYCCFSSKLSRIVHEQGRPQINMGWGTPEAPSCGGILVEDLQRIDFSKIDFSELFADLEANANGKLADQQSTKDKVSKAVQNHFNPN